MTPERKNEILDQWDYTAQWLQDAIIKGYLRRYEEGTAQGWLEYLEWEFGLDDEQEETQRRLNGLRMWE
ncbi:hypothetical protein [Desulfofustis glycolicus]|uniref:Uncharacterized protein n=1 Tax=Desulfofustis glycolicus DSM 9705 TaxID=1121409 RepID=A0A1M5UKI2_9BACT|nr:hypothetical protein [Desulfofustis glycolicus]SHH63471.1 hypothetical protein SAMN02745124_01218 [Desulfofustis glycolicus DSM 9705]